MIKMFTHNINYAHSKKYIKWLSDQEPNKVFHHVIKRKTTDYFGIMLTNEEHTKRHAAGGSKYFQDDIMKSIRNLIKYVQYLEEK